MVNSSFILDDPIVANVVQCNILSGNVKEMESIVYGVYFEVLVEPKAHNEHSDGKCYVIKYETDQAAEESLATVNDHVDRLQRLQKYYTKMLEKALELFAEAKMNYSASDFEVSLLKRRTFVSTYMHYVLTEPEVISMRLESRHRQALGGRVISVRDDVFFDHSLDSGKAEGRAEAKIFELKEIRTPYRGQMLKWIMSEGRYQTTQL